MPTEAQFNFLHRLLIWEREIGLIGNDACTGPFAGFGQAFGKWKEIARRCEDKGLCVYTGAADWYRDCAHTYALTPDGRAALEPKEREMRKVTGQRKLALEMMAGSPDGKIDMTRGRAPFRVTKKREPLPRDTTRFKRLSTADDDVIAAQESKP